METLWNIFKTSAYRNNDPVLYLSGFLMLLVSGGHLTEYWGGGQTSTIKTTLKQTIGLNAMIQ